MSFWSVNVEQMNSAEVKDVLYCVLCVIGMAPVGVPEKLFEYIYISTHLERFFGSSFHLISLRALYERLPRSVYPIF